MDGGLVTATVSLIEEVDKKIMVVLRDGRNIVGTMRSFDQYANVVLEDTVERIFVGNKYCEKHLGVFIIRGENVELLSEIDLPKETTVKAEKWEALPEEDLMVLFNAEKEKREDALKLRKQIRLEQYDPDEG
eukprot:TRINITY_DN15260_c0_g1_i1.p1 TRINITY_DN15260_c0_g1~~TRINITY_DN15260_c0_g1_i1.p1  ORF type:complete len:132 (+),score=25.53 TRINITY_DN15260_c0_g1_i1:41-436(+)